MSSKSTIAFIPGAFRPFGQHHMSMIDQYAKKCDKVVIIISNPQSEEAQRTTCDGNTICAKDAKSIIDLCISDSGLENVSCDISNDENPIKTILKKIAHLNNCDVILGVSQKDNDIRRYSDIDRDFFSDNDVQILPPEETAVKPYEGDFISASEIREHITDKSLLKTYLPVFIEDDTFEKIYDILAGKTSTEQENRYNSDFFSELLSEVVDDDLNLDAEVQEIDEEDGEFPNIRITDETLETSDCGILAYNTQVSEDDESDDAYTPKTNPDKAIIIRISMQDGNVVEIYLDTETKTWRSTVNNTSSLSPQQMEEFFNTDFSRRMTDRISEMWPESDEFFSELLNAVKTKKIDTTPHTTIDEGGEFRKGNINKLKSREKNAAGEQVYTNSGRKIVSFSDFGVKHTDEEAYYCWPEKDKMFKWSQWADWKKIKVLCRARIQHNEYLYGISLSLFPEDNKNRGFRAYNLDLEPKLQYLTPNEASQILQLSIMKKFLRNCLKRLNKLMSMSDQEIYDKINAPEKCTISDIRKTKHVIKNTMKAIREYRHDTYIYT